MLAGAAWYNHLHLANQEPALKVSQEEVVERQTVLNIELDDDDVEPYLARSYRNVVQRVNVPGFRKGRAPRSVVERFVGRQNLLNEILDVMVGEFTSRAIEERELETVGLPSVEVVEFEPVLLKATVPLQPEVDLGAYRDIRIEEPPVDFSEDTVTERLEQIRESQIVWHDVERPVEFGDLVQAELVLTRDGNVLLDQPDASIMVEEGSPYPYSPALRKPGGRRSGREPGVQPGFARRLLRPVPGRRGD